MFCPYKSCFTCPFINEHYTYMQTYSPMRVQPPSNPITITQKEIKYQKPFIQADLKIPEFHGIANTAIQNNINNSIRSDVMEFDRQMQEAAQQYGTKAAQSKEKFIPYVISSIYQLTYNKNNLISILMIYHEYVKGLNSYIKVPYNFDIRTGRSLMLQDLFIPGVNYKTLINEAIKNELLKNKQKYAPETIETFKGVAEDQPFYLENGYLVVFFGFHEIAPTLAKIPIFKFPIASFGNAIKPAYR